VTLGESNVYYQGRGKTSPIVGSTQDFVRIRGARLALGNDLPNRDPHERGRVCVIGRKLQVSLFGEENPLGKRIKVGEADFLVIGTLQPFGESVGIDLDDIVLLPVATAMQLFNRSGLFRVIVQITAVSDIDIAQRRLIEILKERHDGEEDFTILTPGSLATSVLAIIDMITAALSAIAAVSLFVAGIGVMNVMVVTVTERTAEVGLMKALGAGRGQILLVFLAEATTLSLIGGAIGIGAGVLLTHLTYRLYPTIPFHTPWWAIQTSFLVAASVGVAFGILPAWRAARLPPLDALRKKM
jgi:putative ABC transport system permease protein